MRIDYRSFLDKIWEAMPADEYIAMASDPHVLGDPLLKTQHFIGSSKWEYVSETEAIGWHQLRVPHQRYTDESRTEIAVKGHAHGSNQHWYKKIDNVWKFAGLAPIIRWGEFDFDSVFASGRDTFGESDKVEEQIAVAAGVSPEIGLENASQDLEGRTAVAQSARSMSGDVPAMPPPSVESTIQEVSDRSDQTQTKVALMGPEDGMGSLSVEQPHAEQVQLIQLAKEDTKLPEMRVERVSSDDGSITA
ncbi:MAG: hypothetical protein Q9191_000292 [Dirinaria sp. TL-2023a]